MIRGVTIVSLTTLLVLGLYLPSTRPPEHFLLQLREEHLRANEFWGSTSAERIFERALNLQAGTANASPVPSLASAPATAHLHREVGREMARVNQRLFDNPYFRATDALVALATYRLATLAEWAPRYWITALALVVDALLLRAAKAREFRQHDPERFALYASGAIVILCLCALALVWPWSLHPVIWAGAPLLVALFASRALAHYRGGP